MIKDKLFLKLKHTINVLIENILICSLGVFLLASIIYIISFTITTVLALLKLSVFLSNLISPKNSEIYGVIIMGFILLLICIVIKYLEIKKQQKYLPLENTQLSFRQYKYISKKITDLINLYQSAIHQITYSYFTETRGTLIPLDIQISEAEIILNVLYKLKEKIYLQCLADEDISTINRLLLKRHI